MPKNDFLMLKDLENLLFRELSNRECEVLAGGRDNDRLISATLDGGPTRVTITEWDLFVMNMEGKVTYK